MTLHRRWDDVVQTSRARLELANTCVLYYPVILFADSEGPDAQSDLGLRCPHKPEHKFSHGEAQLYMHGLLSS